MPLKWNEGIPTRVKTKFVNTARIASRDHPRAVHRSGTRGLDIFS